MNEYKRVVTDEEDHVDANGKKKLTGRQYARQTAVMLACFLLVLQGLRIYMRRQANLAKSKFEGLEDSLASEMEWKVECGKRAASFVKGCSPSSCARYGIHPPPPSPQHPVVPAASTLPTCCPHNHDHP